MGQIVPVGIVSTVFSSYFSVILSLTTIGYLLTVLVFIIFLISFKVSSYLFSGARSILVIITKNGIFRKMHNPICYFVIFCKPMLAPTTTQPKSGVSPVRPLIVVFKYFSWPQRSTKDIILELFLETYLQYLFLFWLNLSGTTCFPFSSKPIIYWPIELVRPDYCSCW